MLLLFAGHDTSIVLSRLVIKSLGEYHVVYKKVLREGKRSMGNVEKRGAQKMRVSASVFVNPIEKG